MITTTPSHSLFRRHIALPTDHGSWVFLLSPLLIGLFAGGRWAGALLPLIIGALAAFLIRQPITIAIKAYSGRRPRDELPAARFWTLVYGLIGLVSAAGLVGLGFAYVLYLALPAVPVFAWHLYLVSRRAERRQMGIEVVASGVLALAAPAAYWVGQGAADPRGWWLWILTWFQSAASIVYAYLRLEQRALSTMPEVPSRLRMAWRALLYTTFNLLATIGLAIGGLLPTLVFVPYALQWAETLWGALRPAVGQRPTRIGLRQLIVSTLFTILFILCWR